MNTLLEKRATHSNEHHWMLWISPSADQVRQLKNWPSNLKSRVLTLRPRQSSQLVQTLIQAIETRYYAMITLPAGCLCELDEWKIKQIASKHSTLIAWKE